MSNHPQPRPAKCARPSIRLAAPLLAAVAAVAGPGALAGAQHQFSGRSANPDLHSLIVGHIILSPEPGEETPGPGGRHGIFLQGSPLLVQAKVTSGGTRVLTGGGFVYPYDHFPPLVGIERRIDPNLTAPAPGALVEAPEAEPEPVHIGVSLLRSGRYAQAADVFAAERESAEAADDSEGAPDPDGQAAEAADPLARKDAARLEAVALVGAGRVDDAAGMMLDLYRETPYLATAPVSGEAIFGDGLELRRLVTRAVRNAHREASPRAWLLVAVLMQAEGRDELAAKMLGRAADLGLDEAIVKAWPGAGASGG